MAYLAEKFEVPAHWVGKDIQSRAKISEYLHYQHTHLRKGAMAFYKTFFADLENPDVDAELQVKKLLWVFVCFFSFFCFLSV
jgi:hypothetical protein